MHDTQQAHSSAVKDACDNIAGKTQTITTAAEFITLSEAALDMLVWKSQTSSRPGDVHAGSAVLATYQR
jgi:hypothetical protein